MADDLFAAERALLAAIANAAGQSDARIAASTAQRLTRSFATLRAAAGQSWSTPPFFDQAFEGSMEMDEPGPP